MRTLLNIDWQQILLHLFNFLILTLGLYLLLYKPVRDFMEKREQYYHDLDQQAKEKNRYAEELGLSYKERLSSVDVEIEEKRTIAAQESKQAAALYLQSVEKRATKIISDARKAAEKERAQILKDAQEDIVLMAIHATEKLLAQSDSESLDLFLDVATKGASK
ncbi:MAG TPA: hypothetical protein DDZ89_15735 [Clostridiales bacterium]|nr:hypothetical protein [Clostridiales bacterium]